MDLFGLISSNLFGYTILVNKGKRSKEISKHNSPLLSTNQPTNQYLGDTNFRISALENYKNSRRSFGIRLPVVQKLTGEETIQMWEGTYKMICSYEQRLVIISVIRGIQ